MRRSRRLRLRRGEANWGEKAAGEGVAEGARIPLKEERKVSPRTVRGGVTALALIALAPLACEPAVACSQMRVAEGALDSPHAAQPVAEARFDWPVRGPIVIECWTEDKERITIAAQDGAAVRAAQSGLVIYAGALKGYGSLVAIRHAGGFVSATYGDIGDLRVKAHDAVERGQRIAAIRSSGRFSEAQLKFEVRRGIERIDVRTFMNSPQPPREDGSDFLLAR
jgi:murein DD-endopeptidase MepM/ murein hydrolase activator NlpD